MRTNFEEYFYHDVYIKDILINLKEERKNIQFILESEDDGITTCVFNKIYDCSFNLWLNRLGDNYILDAKIENEDEFLTKFKDNPRSISDKSILKNIQCYIIYSDIGIIKILSSEDVSPIK